MFIYIYSVSETLVQNFSHVYIYFFANNKYNVLLWCILVILSVFSIITSPINFQTSLLSTWYYFISWPAMFSFSECSIHFTSSPSHFLKSWAVSTFTLYEWDVEILNTEFLHWLIRIESLIFMQIPTVFSNPFFYTSDSRPNTLRVTYMLW